MSVSESGSEVLRVLAPTRYLWKFNGPRQSRHEISNRSFIAMNRLPFSRITTQAEGLTILNPFPPAKFDLIHAFNRIPIGSLPYIIGFESHLPRAFGLQETRYFRMLSNMLASDRCRAIIAISKYARGHFLAQHKGKPWQKALEEKLIVRYPNFPVAAKPNALELKTGEPIRLVFVGSHFGRKGGSVAVWLAEQAERDGLRVEVDIVSSMTVGAASWVDPVRPEFFNLERELMHQLPNVRHHGSLPNEAVLELIKQAHFSLLPTFSDTFGFSAIESMSESVPVVATAQGALPEFIHDGENGILLTLPTSDIGAWTHVGRGDRHTAEYEDLFRSESKRLATETCARLKALLERPEAYSDMRLQAHAKAKELFSADDANEFWDDFYCKVMR